jgi:hypothetical protein
VEAGRRDHLTIRRKSVNNHRGWFTTLLITVCALMGFGAAALTVPASAVPTSDSVTCQEFRVWNSHPTTQSLERLMAASVSAPWKYVGGDVWELYGAVRADGLNGKNVAKDRRFVASDCR